MHDSVFHWVGEKVKYCRETGISLAQVLEIGSFNVNGTVRGHFEGSVYTATDMRDGPGVDIVCNGHQLPFEDASFNAVVCVEVFEHDELFWVTTKEMGRVLKSGGVLFLTARGNGFPEHGFPNDYWRFMPESFKTLLQLAGCNPVDVRPDPQECHPGVFGFGVKI